MEVSGELHAPIALPPGETATDDHCIGGWLGHRVDLDAVKKILQPLLGIVAGHYSD